MYILKKCNNLILIIILLISIILVNFSFKAYYKIEYPLKYIDMVEKYSNEFGVDKYLSYSVIRSESNFNPYSVSSVGAKGVMQITDDTYFWLIDKLDSRADKNSEDLFNPENNIKYGVFFLSILLSEFKDVKTALAGYHAGMGNVRKWLKESDSAKIQKIPFRDTELYVNKTYNTYRKYKKLYK